MTEAAIYRAEIVKRNPLILWVVVEAVEDDGFYRFQMPLDFSRGPVSFIGVVKINGDHYAFDLLSNSGHLYKRVP